jgi:hypothetical protein
MPALIAVFLRLVGYAIVPLGWKLLRGLGFTAVSYVGLSAALDKIKDLVMANFTSVPVEVINVLGLLKIDVCFNIILSALVARTLLRGFSSSGEKKSFRWGG